MQHFEQHVVYGNALRVFKIMVTCQDLMSYQKGEGHENQV